MLIINWEIRPSWQRQREKDGWFYSHWEQKEKIEMSETGLQKEPTKTLSCKAQSANINLITHYTILLLKDKTVHRQGQFSFGHLLMQNKITLHILQKSGSLQNYVGRDQLYIFIFLLKVFWAAVSLFVGPPTVSKTQRCASSFLWGSL